MEKFVKKDGINTLSGRPYIYGATLYPEGCNFALFSKNATSVSLLLFNDYKDSEPAHIIALDKRLNKTGDMWHIFVEGIKEGQYYGYAVDGPYDPVNGHRFNVNKLLIDPYSKAVSGHYHWNKSSAYGYDRNHPDRDLFFCKIKNYDTHSKSIVVDDRDFDWEGDKPLHIPMKDTIIYETHVRGFTRHPSSKVNHPGSYIGLIEKIPYLKELGITTVELLPVHEFNELEKIETNPLTGEKLVNYTGYSTLAFFAPDSWYSTKREGLTAVREFKEMVKALHKAGIEVILDVVYNHTGEGNEMGPTLSFKGLDNSIYYMLENGRYYKNYSGCGNTMNCNHPVVKRMIKDSLRYWVVDMHVDGFRFDLAAILGRDENGHWVPDYSVLSEISHDPILSNTKLIAEGWDAAGLYKVGGFPEGWAEWNGKFRDDVRAFVKGDAGAASDLAKRISGSADLYFFGSRKPYHSINFITSHDGFTLNDLVSYNNKHNIANAENNRDGDSHNLSWNCGVEGETDDKKILELRERQMRNFITILMISQGTPMLFSGDEVKFTKKGNNNTYCHDNELNWFDWNLIYKNRDFFEFCKALIAFRKKHPSLRREDFFLGEDFSQNNLNDINWHGVKSGKPDWSPSSRSLAFMIDGSKPETGSDKKDNDIYVALNSYWDTLEFELPTLKNKNWHLVVNTYETSGFYPEDTSPVVKENKFKVRERSAIVLISK
jgi:glycogen operon protein